ncbi:unnamed protein product, partial [Ectocarpus sp. 13 AM-2016]
PCHVPAPCLRSRLNRAQTSCTSCPIRFVRTQKCSSSLPQGQPTYIREHARKPPLGILLTQSPHRSDIAVASVLSPLSRVSCFPPLLRRRRVPPRWAAAVVCAPAP